jgi:hypothetical protein
MKLYNKIILLFLGVALFTACKNDGEYDHPIVVDNIPEVPVIFPGATTAGFNPYYTVSLANGNISIQISTAEGSPVQIKEITKMIAGATGITPGNVGTLANYLAAPIAVNGSSATITTTITEFNTKVAAAARVPATIAAGTFQERAFMFLITLEDNTTVIPQQLRMRVIP